MILFLSLALCLLSSVDIPRGAERAMSAIDTRYQPVWGPLNDGGKVGLHTGPKVQTLMYCFDVMEVVPWDEKTRLVGEEEEEEEEDTRL